MTRRRGYRGKDSYISKDPEKRLRQLANLKSQKKLEQPEDKRGQQNPFNERFKGNLIKYLERHFYIPESRKPIVLDEWQKEKLSDLFERDETGKRKHTLAIWSTPKKNGKSTIAAGIANYELFQGEDYGEIIITANSERQGNWIIYDKLRKSLLMNPRQKEWLKITDEYIENKKSGTVCRVIPPNWRTSAGLNPSLTIFDELWAYDLETARKFWEELTTVPTRQEPLTLVVTYAGYDEDTLLFDLYQKGLKRKDPKMFFFWTHDNLASWVDEEYLKTQKKRLRPNTYLRLHENRWTESASAFIDMEDYDECVDRKHKPFLPDKSIKLTVGVDASVTGDSTAVVAVTKVENQILVARHRKWQPSKKQPIDLEGTVEAYIKELARDYIVREVRYDPYQLHRSAVTLRRAGIRMVEFPQTADRLTEMSQNLYDLIKGRNLTVYRDKELRSHISKAVAKETPRGFRIVKEKQSHKIDLVIALGMACLSAVKSTVVPVTFRWLGASEPEERDMGWVRIN